MECFACFIPMRTQCIAPCSLEDAITALYFEPEETSLCHLKLVHIL